MNLKNTTRFLAKKYFDVSFCKYPDFCEKNPILVVITCLRTAVKVHIQLFSSIKFVKNHRYIQSTIVYSNPPELSPESSSLAVRSNYSMPWVSS